MVSTATQGDSRLRVETIETTASESRIDLVIVGDEDSLPSEGHARRTARLQQADGTYQSDAKKGQPERLRDRHLYTAAPDGGGCPSDLRS